MIRRFAAFLKGALAVSLALGTAACADDPMGPTGTTLHITAVSPPNGSTTGATTVTITGTGFASGATVTIGGVAASNVAVQSATSLTATVGSRPNGGAADVVVTSGGTNAILTNGFTYVAPSGANQAPSIGVIRSIGSRANQPSGFGDLNETLTVIAAVTDVESALSALTYEWSGPGAFAGAASTTSWQLPATLATTPSPATATLKVTETFSEGGVTHRNTSTGTFVVQVHNSQREILDAGVDFLTLWSNSSNSTNTVLHNFSTTCDGGRGRNDEARDTDNAHAQFVQDFPRFTISSIPPVTYNFGGVCLFGDRVRPADACSAHTVHWEINQIPGGQRVITDGIDYVSAVLENNVWKLCHSDFFGSSRNGLTRVETTLNSILPSGPLAIARHARPR